LPFLLQLRRRDIEPHRTYKSRVDHAGCLAAEKGYSREKKGATGISACCDGQKDRGVKLTEKLLGVTGVSAIPKNLKRKKEGKALEGDV